MKIFTLFTLLVLQMSLTAQEIIPIPVDTTSVWRVERYYNDEWCVYHYNSIYYINGTEVKNGKEYYKVYEEGHHWKTSVNPQYPCIGDGNNYSGVYRGGIRTENGKIYGYVAWESPDLLMDFLLGVGDTLFIANSDYYIINSIDSVLVGNDYRKKFHLSSYWNSTWWIEGVGHQGGLFESMDWFESGSTLICYGENYIPIFGNLNCDITVGQEEKYKDAPSIQAFPNPTKGILDVRLSNIEAGVLSYVLTDIYGKTIINHQVTSLKAENYQLDIKECRAGIYLLTIILNNGGSLSKRIIKI